jgi:hypothetical protein
MRISVLLLCAPPYLETHYGKPHGHIAHIIMIAKINALPTITSSVVGFSIFLLKPNHGLDIP